MVFDHQRPNLCNTILSLGLGYISNTNDHTKSDYDDHNHNHNHNHILFPSLSLALPSDRETLNAMDPTSCTTNLITHRLKRLHQKEDSSGSASVEVLSSSHSSVKREVREVSGDQEEEEERIDYSAKNNYSNIGHDQEQDEEGPRKKLRLSKEQSFVLEESFKEHSTLNPKQKQVLANKLNLRPRQVEVWFQNRRARTKLKQTEVDFEILKKCCETLKDENKRLHKEMQELKAMKVSLPSPAAPAPFYMQFPAATLSMCPSCESLSAASGGGAGGSGENPSRISFSRSAKSARFYNPFANHPSAAC